MENKLTILIPTYNREKCLLKTLQSIYKQGHWGEYKIIISNNHSDYSVDKLLNDNFDGNFRDSISLFTWNFSLGMSTNISLPFVLVETEWCWFISDDDDIRDDALDIIFMDIKKYSCSNVAAIKYSIDPFFTHKEHDFTSVREIAQYYLRMEPGNDDRLYLSMLYNMVNLNPYLINLTNYSYTHVSFWLPVLCAVNSGEFVLKTSSDKLFTYYKNLEDAWYSNPKKYLNTLLGIRTICDNTFGIDYESYRLFSKMLLSENFKYNIVIRLICNIEDKHDRKRYYKLLKNYLVGTWIDKLRYTAVYYVICYPNIKPSTIKSMLAKIRGVF